MTGDPIRGIDESRLQKRSLRTVTTDDYAVANACHPGGVAVRQGIRATTNEPTDVALAGGYEVMTDASRDVTTCWLGVSGRTGESGSPKPPPRASTLHWPAPTSTHDATGRRIDAREGVTRNGCEMRRFEE